MHRYHLRVTETCNLKNTLKNITNPGEYLSVYITPPSKIKFSKAQPAAFFYSSAK